MPAETAATKMTVDSLTALLKEHGQEHLLEYIDVAPNKDAYLAELEALNVPYVVNLYKGVMK